VVTIRIDAQTIVLETEDGRRANAVHGGVTHALNDALWRLDQERHHRFAIVSDVAVGTDHGSALGHRLTAVGTQLGKDFLAGEVGERLIEEIDAAERAGRKTRIALRITDSELANLPWEALVAPGRSAPVVLEHSVELYRSTGNQTDTTAPNIPGPLRILVVLAAPVGPGSGPDLDLERELQLIVTTVATARRQSHAYVRVLNEGTVDAVQEALTKQPFHVLHISCHAGPGILLLEDKAGGVARVTGPELVDHVPADRVPPLIVLAGCSTALIPQREQEFATNKMAGLAWELSAAGIPAVVAMTAPVTDSYARRFCSTLYEELALTNKKGAQPDVLSAVAATRRHIEEQLAASPAGSREKTLVEWATPALYLAGEPLPLYDPSQPFETIEHPTPPPLHGDVLRPIGDFVGRRVEMRVLLDALGSTTCPGVLLHGIGGIGKSSLAAEAIRKIGDQAGIVVCVYGQTDPDRLLETVAQTLTGLASAAPGDPLSRAAMSLNNQREPWKDRFAKSLRPLLDQVPMLLLLDSFEDNLNSADRGYRLADPELADLLSLWVRHRGRGHLLLTSRYPFSLPDDIGPGLRALALGPLSFAETLKLAWRLPALNALEPAQLDRARTDVGGHPRTLEYLDALLRRGHAKFGDVADRMERLLRDRKGVGPAEWRHDEHDFDTALADAVALSADDVVLTSLLDSLDDFTRRVLVGAAVYRHPVDEWGIAWPVSTEKPVDAELKRRFDSLFTKYDLNVVLDKIATRDWSCFAPDEMELITKYRAALNGPPIAVPERVPAAVRELVKAGLLSVSRLDNSRDGYFVHRWTATSLLKQERCEPAQLAAIHKAASAYWQWLAQHPPKRTSDGMHGVVDNVIDCFEESLHHLQCAGDESQFAHIAEGMANRLAERGSWRRATQTYRAALASTKPGTREYALLSQRLGEHLLNTGALGSAKSHQEAALDILTKIGDRASATISLRHLGVMAARVDNDYRRAEELIERSVRICTELNIHDGLVAAKWELGRIAEQRGDYRGAKDRYEQTRQAAKELNYRDALVQSLMSLGAIASHLDGPAAAEEYYLQALQASSSLDSRSRKAMILSNLGSLAIERGDLTSAEKSLRDAFGIFADIGDRASVANVLYHLGMVAHARQDLPRAAEYYTKSLALRDALGDRPGSAKCLHQLGLVTHHNGDLAAAEDLFSRAHDINRDIGNRADAATNIGQLGQIAHDRGDHARAGELYGEALSVFEQAGDRVNATKVKRMLADLARDRGEHQAADEGYGAAGTIAKELGDHDGVRTVDRARTVNMAKQVHSEGLDGKLRQFIEICKREGHAKEAGLGWLAIGDIALLREDYEAAEDSLRHALTVFHSVGEDRHVADTLRSLAAVAERRRDLAAAENEYRQSLTIWERLGDQAEVAKAHHHLGCIAERQNNYPGAIQSLLLGLQLNLQLRQDIRNDAMALLRIRNHLGHGRFTRIVTEQRDALAAEQINASLNVLSRKAAAP
jgi:tetratricopeptide (TPR) repeat protein